MWTPPPPPRLRVSCPLQHTLSSQALAPPETLLSLASAAVTDAHFNVGSGEPNFGLHTCPVNTLPSKYFISNCSVAVKRHHDHENSCKRINWARLTVSEV